jgi:phosphoribosyl-ATP pyrophosphohydrolase
LGGIGLEFIRELQILIEKRKRETPEGSYTASLFRQGIDKIAKKVGEESAEVIIASKNNSTPTRD